MPNLANGVQTVLGVDITNSATTITVPSGKGAMFPSGDFSITLDDGIHQEIIYVPTGGRSTDTFSGVTRASEAYAGAQTAYAFSAATPTNLALTVTVASLGNTVRRFYRPAGGETVNSLTPAAWSTPVQITGVVVNGSQNVQVHGVLEVTLTDYPFLYLYRSGTLLASWGYQALANTGACSALHFMFTDVAPAAGTYTYEIRAASHVAVVMTLYQSGASTSSSGAVGTSQMVAEVYTP